MPQSDFIFTDVGFSATEVGVRPISEAGKAFFAHSFGSAAISATLRKSGAFEMEFALGKEGLSVEWQEAA